jgi:predicted nucleotide-binding protein
MATSENRGITASGHARVTGNAVASGDRSRAEIRNEATARHEEQVISPPPPPPPLGPEPAPSPSSPDISRTVFIVHGRDGILAAGFRDLLRAVSLQPLEWEPLVRATQSTSPFVGQVVATAPRLAQATLVLLSPHDIVELHPDLVLGSDRPAERARSMQARPNVFYELGLAMMACPERTIVVEVGDMRPAGDLAGLNVIRFDGTGPAISKVLARLAQAGCPVDLSGTDWMDQGRWPGLDGPRQPRPLRGRT